MTVTEPRSEAYLRLSARSTILAFVLSLLVTSVFVTTIIAPDGALARGFASAPWFIPLFIVFVVVGHQAWARRHKWDPRAPEAKALMNDELRQIAADRAARMALLVVLLAQPLIGAVMTQLPMPVAAFVMAAVTMELGIATFLALFYIRFYATDGHDGR